jgi:hypothetical protein
LKSTFIGISPLSEGKFPALGKSDLFKELKTNVKQTQALEGYISFNNDKQILHLFCTSAFSISAHLF